jgi:tRNA threonylcarbamoyladenosine biosynthesis protein TsaB
MKHYLSIQNTYTHVEMALFQDSQMINWVAEDKLRASKNFVLLISGLLQEHCIKFSDLSFLAVNQGPGPFTTLRVVIASVNGLSYATKVPLVGVDALDALLIEHESNAYSHTIALLNAFNQDVYFGISTRGMSNSPKGYKNIDIFLSELQALIPDQAIRFIGNGAELYHKEISAAFGPRAYIPTPMPQTASVQQIGIMGLHQWDKQENVTYELYPLYLKQAIVSPIII